MNTRIILSSILILFLEFSYANVPSEFCEVREQSNFENPLSVQNFEVRAFIVDIEQAQLQLSLLNAEFKGEYEFSDYIYYPQEKDFDLNKEFIRLRVYQKTQWDQKVVELSHKVKTRPGVSGGLKLKKQFNAIEEADAFLSDYRFSFSYQRKGFEYQLDDVKIFLEDVQGLPPSVELVSPSKKNIDQLFDKLAPTQILSDSIPQLVQNILENMSK
ncbi:MAG TPA: hypothetical protein VLE95_05260 [Chlamydiales bacterium]|nr:hypothetical protein [Chlamydiales bacterium]